MEILEINRFSELHNNVNIFFTKTEFLQSDFSYIRNLKNEVVVISGNSDYPINSSRMVNLPENVVKWYAQNALENHPKLEPLPIGIENKFHSHRDGHGIGYLNSSSEKQNLIRESNNIKPTKKIYSNFNINTNFHYRNIIKNICIKSQHIDWEEPRLSIKEFFNKVLNYESVVCPVGNGVDTHRLWEILYLNRIPITVKVGNFKIYELYEKLPIVVLNNESELFDKDLLENEIKKAKEKKYDSNLLDYNFWKNKIYDDLKLKK